MNFTLWNDVSSFTCSAQNLRFVVNWFYALFMCNGTSKPSVTSKPSLTIALKILKTIEKLLTPMVGPSKNIQWWWSNIVKTIEKPLKSMVAWKKNINHSIALKKLTIVVVYTGGKKPFSCSQCEVTMDLSIAIARSILMIITIAIQGKKITNAMNVKVHL